MRILLTKSAALGEYRKVHPNETRDIRELDTHFQKKERGKIRWHVVDADGVVLGRLAARTARILIGKDSADWTPYSDHRDGIIVVNAEKVRLTGKKLDQKMYRHYTGYPGGLKETSAQRLLETKPEELVREAVVGMLPKSRLGSRLATRLKVYAGPRHPHQAQNPVPAHLAV
jgi:large subunit ribosomal protein L13